MSALPPLNRGGEGARSRVEIWSKQIVASQPAGTREQPRSSGNRRRELSADSIPSEAKPAAQRLSAVTGGIGGAAPARAVSAVRSVVPATATALRVAYRVESPPLSLELVPLREGVVDVAADGDAARGAGKVHRLGAELYARAASTGYPWGGRSVGGRLDVRA